MYELLLQLPLFQGLNHTVLESFIEKVPFHFMKYPKGATIVSKNDHCTHMKFVINGKIKTEREKCNGKIKIIEEFSAPNIIAPNYLFGKITKYPYDVYAVEDTGIMQIDKISILTLMMENQIFLMNMLNITSNKWQSSNDAFSFLTAGDMRVKIACWILSLSEPKGENFRIICKQKDLYTFFGSQRSVFTYALNELKKNEILDYDTKEVKVLDRYALKEICRENSHIERSEEIPLL